MRLSSIILALVLSATAADAQTWTELQAVPTNTEVRVEEQGGRSGHAEGILQSVDAVQLTILRNSNPVSIPRDRIARVQARKADPVWEGALFGLLSAGASHGAFGTGWSRREMVWNYLGSIGIGMLFDWSHTARRTVYKAP